MIYPVILSGGSGTRLWPLSRATYPKQFLSLMGEDSLLQQTVLRFYGRPDFAAPAIIANNDHRFLVAEQLRSADIEGASIILEPVARNTGPAAIVAALHVHNTDPNGVVVLLSSDAAIRDVDGLHSALAVAAQAAQAGKLVTFGMEADRPETGYGYIKQGTSLDGVTGAFTVARFVEKPDLAGAEAMLAEGGYAWNSGMFVYQAKAFLDEAASLEPEMLAACRAACEKAETDLDFLRLDEAAMKSCPAESIDVAIMERTDHAAVVPAEIGWSDLGAWQALWDISDKDADGNVTHGDVFSIGTKNSYLRSTDTKTLAAIGLDDVTVVVTEDAVLAARSDMTPKVKDMVTLLAKADRPQAVEHPLVYRPWGSYQDIDYGQGFRVKRIVVKPGASLSLQRHIHRSEHWIIVNGVAQVTCGDKEMLLHENESTYIPVMAMHRLANPGKVDLHMIEVQVGSYVGEDDIERFEDTYGRA